MSDSTRLSVNINRECADALQNIAERRGVSLTEAVRIVISIGHFVDMEVAEGNAIQVKDRNGYVSEVDFS
ncbi:ribbon-helix-helix protein, CopG family [Rhodococcus pyridinivorans]|uniref:ribbon-helix-helix protein, CopG family n=1 Tax=Rhodococcus pyridinivorans TaxID=103816 RepID=UPI003D7FA3D4